MESNRDSANATVDTVGTVAPRSTPPEAKHPDTMAVPAVPAAGAVVVSGALPTDEGIVAVYVLVAAARDALLKEAARDARIDLDALRNGFSRRLLRPIGSTRSSTPAGKMMPYFNRPTDLAPASYS